jgi:excisionase family DNA binding protein
MLMTEEEIGNYYTYEEACDALGVSLSTLNRAIARGVLTPVRRRGQTKKYLLKTDVDTTTDEELFSQRKNVNMPSVDLAGIYKDISINAARQVTETIIAALSEVLTPAALEPIAKELQDAIDKERHK